MAQARAAGWPPPCRRRRCAGARTTPSARSRAKAAQTARKCLILPLETFQVRNRHPPDCGSTWIACREFAGFQGGLLVGQVEVLEGGLRRHCSTTRAPMAIRPGHRVADGQTFSPLPPRVPALRPQRGGEAAGEFVQAGSGAARREGVGEAGAGADDDEPVDVVPDES